MPRIALGALCALAPWFVVGCGSGGGSKGTAAPTATASPTTASATTAGGSAPASPTAAPVSTAPVFSSLTPDRGTVAGGTLVTLRGRGFQAVGAGQTLVLFGTTAVPATVVGDQELRAVAPASASLGQVEVRVLNDLGAATTKGAFSYDPRPAQLRFDPPVGHSELGYGGTEITLSAQDFVAPLTSAVAVSFGGVPVPASDVTLTGPQSLRVLLPDGVTPGTVDVVVSEHGQQALAPGFLVQGDLRYGDLIVNELCPHPGGIDTNGDGFGDSQADEFVEVLNTTAQPVDLTFLVLMDSREERHRFPNPTTLPPGGAIVVFGAGTSHRFPGANRSGSAQQATTGGLALNNTDDSVQIRTLPRLNPTGVGDLLFRVDYLNPPNGSSLVNRTDGGAIVANPASSAADYEDHVGAPGATQGWSPGRRNDGSDF